MNEQLLPKDVLQKRTDAIILSFRHMIRNGLDPADIRTLEDEAPDQHRDFIGVYLGIKPAAQNLVDVFDCFDGIGPRNYLDDLPIEKDTGVTVHNTGLIEGVSVWNPQLVKQVLQQNPDIPGSQSLNPDDTSSFAEFLDGFSSHNQLLHGIILGFPRKAVELYTKHFLTILDVADTLWGRAQVSGTVVRCAQPSFTISLCEEENIHNPLVRDEFLRLAKLFGYEDQELIDYVKGVRLADVPGWRYITTGDITTQEEKKTRDFYAASGYDERLERLLNEYGV